MFDSLVCTLWLCQGGAGWWHKCNIGVYWLIQTSFKVLYHQLLYQMCQMLYLLSQWEQFGFGLPNHWPIMKNIALMGWFFVHLLNKMHPWSEVKHEWWWSKWKERVSGNSKNKYIVGLVLRGCTNYIFYSSVILAFDPWDWEPCLFPFYCLIWYWLMAASDQSWWGVIYSHCEKMQVDQEMVQPLLQARIDK